MRPYFIGKAATAVSAVKQKPSLWLPESCHAIAAAVREARKCTESGEPKVILFNLSGHGLIDMAAYDKYLAGDLVNYSLSDEQIKRNIGELDAIG